ncbi:ankyrin repeat protein [Fowlpox virus]|nr:ankyrin repeat protein [Fowlpox virus]
MLKLEHVYRSIYEDNHEKALSKILEYNSLSTEEELIARRWVDSNISMIEFEYFYDYYCDYDDYGYHSYSTRDYMYEHYMNNIHRMHIVDFPYSFLHQAIQARESGLVEAILKYKIYDNDKDKYKENNPLHTLTSMPDITYIKLFLDVTNEETELINEYITRAKDMKLITSVSINIIKQIIKGNHYMTNSDLIALEEETKKEEYKIANILLAHKEYYINETDKNGHTSLQNAFISKNIPLIRLLLSKGATAKIDYYGYSIFDLAAMTGNIDIVKDVINIYGYDYDKESKILYDIVKMNNIPMINLLLELGLNVNTSSNSSETPLHNAAKLGYKEITELLISKGAYVDSKDICGFTPLFFSLKYPEIIKLLLDNGADPNKVIKTSLYTPLKKAMCESIEFAKVIVPYVALSEYKISKDDLVNEGLVINLEIINRNEELKNIYGECKLELKLMESIRLSEYYSLNAFLKYDDVKILSPLVYHKKVNNIDESIFPKYYAILYKKIQVAKDRAYLVKNAVSELFYILSDNHWSLLPVEIENKIVSLLDNKDLERIVNKTDN